MGQEQRTDVRHKAFLYPLSCEKPGSKDVSINVDDISSSGVGITINEQLFECDIVDLEIFLPEDDIPMFVTGEVAWVSKSKEVKSHYNAGIRLKKVTRGDKERMLNFIRANLYR